MGPDRGASRLGDQVSVPPQEGRALILSPGTRQTSQLVPRLYLLRPPHLLKPGSKASKAGPKSSYPWVLEQVVLSPEDETVGKEHKEGPL